MNKIINAKLIILLFSILFVFSISSCKWVKYNGIDLSAQEQKWGSEIIRCIKEKDKISLSNLFCSKVKNTDYLEKEIDFFFDYVDRQGGIVIDDCGKWVGGGGHGAYSGGRRVIQYDGHQYDKKVLIGNKEYTLSYGAYITLIEHKEYEGITLITFRDGRNLLDATLDQRNIALNDRTPGEYLGIGIFDTNYETYLRENVAPKEIYENEEYRFDSNQLEEGHSEW